MEPFIARYSRWRMALLFALSLGFVALGLFLGGAFGDVPQARTSPAATQAVGWICVLFFGACAAVIGQRAFDGRAQIVVGPEGVFARSWSDAVIGWQAIADVTTWSHRGQRFVILSLRDRAAYPARPGLLAWTAGVNRRLTGGDVPIALTGMNRGFDEALGAIGHFREAAREGSSASPGP